MWPRFSCPVAGHGLIRPELFVGPPVDISTFSSRREPGDGRSPGSFGCLELACCVAARIMPMPVLQKQVYGWWGRGRVSAPLGLSLRWRFSSLLPPSWAGGVGIDTPSGRSYSCEVCNSWCVSLLWRREARTPPIPVMLVARVSRMPSSPAWGSTPAGVYV